MRNFEVKLVAAIAHQFRLLVTLVAVRAVHVAQVTVVRIGFNLSRLLGELLIAVAALADLLFTLAPAFGAVLWQVSHF